MYEFPSGLRVVTWSAKHQLINCIHACSHSVTLLSISEKSVGNPSSLRILPREIVAYVSILV